METDRILFMYNPNAGTKRIQEELHQIMMELTKDQREVLVWPTREAGEIERIIPRYVRTGRCNRVVVSGGDGTVHEAVNAMMRCRKRVPIVYLPAGSTNDFGYSLGLQQGLAEAAKVIWNGTYFPCDVAKANSRYYIYTAAFGMFTDVSYATPQKMKNIFGHAAYVLNGVGQIAKPWKIPMRVEFNGKTIEDQFVLGMVVSSQSIGGIRGITGADVSLNDGEHELLLVRYCKPVDIPKLVRDLLMGNTGNEHIVYEKVRKVTFTSPESVAWTFDGEFGGDFKRLDIDVISQGVTFLVPKKNEQDKAVLDILV